jgi:hypothetical protein
MKIGSTIIVVLLAAACLAAMLYVRNQDATRTAQGSQSRRLLTEAQLPLEQLERITLSRSQGNVRMAFAREGANWKQVEPFEYPMDAFSIRQLANAARELEVSGVVDAASISTADGLTSIGLQLPAAQLTYEWPSGSLSLELGRRGVAGRAYLRKAGESTVYIVNQTLHERAIEMEPKEWRDRTIFHDASIESARVEWQQGSAAGMAIDRDRKQWRMTAPVQSRVDPVGRDAYLQDLAAAKVAGFILDQPSATELSQFGLTNPVATLTLTNPASPGNSSQTTQRLLVGSPAAGSTQDYYGMIEGRPVVVRLSATTLGALFRQPQNLVNPTASGVVSADVKTIVIRTIGGELKLERNLEQWNAPEIDNTEVNAAYVQELLDQLTKLRAPAVDFREYPRELDIATITLHGYDGKAIDTVRIANDPTTSRWILENGDNVLRLFPAGLKMRMAPADFGL